MSGSRPKYKGTNIPTRLQKKLLEASLDNLPNKPMKELAESIGVNPVTVGRWFENRDFSHWWVMSHYEGARGMYVEKIMRATFERAIQPDATAKDRELALQILDPARLNKAKRLPTRPNIVVNFVGTEKRLDIPHVEGRLPPEPKLLDFVESKIDECVEGETEEIIEVEAEVA